MSSSRKTDAASKLRSDYSITGAAPSGKILPLSQAADVLNAPASTPAKVLQYPAQSQNRSSYDGVDIGYSASIVRENQNLTVANAVTQLNDYVQGEQRDLEFSVSGDSDAYQVKVVNRHSGELIRLIANNEVLDLARKLNDQEPFSLFSAQV